MPKQYSNVGGPISREDLSRRKNLDSNTQTEDSGNDQCDDSDDLDSIILTTGKDAKEFGYSAGMFNTSLNVLEKVARFYFLYLYLASIPLLSEFSLLSVITPKEILQWG